MEGTDDVVFIRTGPDFVPVAVLAWSLPPIIAAVGIVAQYVVFMNFVSSSGTSHGQHVPFVATTAALIVLAAALLLGYRRRGASGWFVLLLVVYLTVIWSLVAASTGVISVIGSGEAFL